MNEIQSILFFSAMSAMGSVLYPFATFPTSNIKLSFNNWYILFGKAAILLIITYSFKLYGSYTVGNKVPSVIQQFIWMTLNMIGVLIFSYYWKKEKFNYHRVVSILILLIALIHDTYYNM